MIPKIELKSSKEIKKFQEKKLNKLLTYLIKNSKYYRNLFKKNNIDINGINSIEDLVKIPVTTKEQLHKYNKEFICVPEKKIIDYTTTSGTLGDPITIILTENDLNVLAYNEAISFACAGINKNDIVQLSTTIDKQFMAGLAYFLGARKIGCGIIRTGAGSTELQWNSILKYSPTYLITVPSFLLKLIEYANKNNIDLNSCSVKNAICIGESIRNEKFSENELSKKIKSNWNIKLFSTYASTEMRTAFTECEHNNGGHHHPELLIIEVLDHNDNPVKNGCPGELTITTIAVEGMPLLRFKTGDIIKTHSTKCKCGRNTFRLSPVIGRKNHMIKLKGTSIYPDMIYNVLNKFDEINEYILELNSIVGSDQIIIKILSDNPSKKLSNKIILSLKANIKVSPIIKFIDNEKLKKLQFPKLSRKKRKLIDNRNKKITLDYEYKE